MIGKFLSMACLAMLPVMASAEVETLVQTTGVIAPRKSITSHYDKLSQQYCLIFVVYEGVGMDCKHISSFPEDVQRRILGTQE